MARLFLLAVTLCAALSSASVGQAQRYRRAPSTQPARTSRPSVTPSRGSFGRAPRVVLSRTPRASRAPERGRIVRLTDMRGDTVVATLRAQLAAMGFRGKRVIVRFIDRGRVGVARRTGTDRDATSTRFDIPTADSSAALRAEAGVPDTHLTYAHELDLSGDRVEIVMPDGQRHDYANYMSELEEIGGTSIGGAVAVYDPRTLVRAPASSGRPSLAEFWFRGNPRNSLLFLIDRPPTRDRTRTE